jgi:hypothetical protein
MTPRGGPPSQLPTLTEVWADPSSADFENSTSALRRLDTVPGALNGVVSTGVGLNAGTAESAVAEPMAHTVAMPAPQPQPQTAAVRVRPVRPDVQPLRATTTRPGELRAGVDPQVDEPAVARPAMAGLDAAPDDPAPGDDPLVAAVLQDLQRHVDLMLEYRLRASLTPVLTQLADNLVHELRQELSETLRDVVKRSVRQELVRRRKR